MSVKKRREREREARREAILDAGERVLEEVGYRSLRMEQVAEAAELSKGTLYLYFAGKDALCAGIAERRMVEMAPAVRHLADTAPDGLTAVARMSRGFGQSVRQRPHVLRFAVDWFQAPRLDDDSDDFRRYRDAVGQVLQLMVATIQRGQQDGSIRADVDPFHKAIHSWSSSIGVYLFLVNAGGMQQRMGRQFDPEALMGQHIETLLRSLASSPEAAARAKADSEAAAPTDSDPAHPTLRKAAGDR